VPKPTHIKDSSVFATAAENVTQTIQSALTGKISAGWPTQDLSFSLAVVSLGQDDPGIPLWEHHHRAERNVNGTKLVNRDSQYLIGSISKVITDYILLKSNVSLDSPVTQFLPQLAQPQSLVPWNSVTLRMLASQLGGVPANTGGFSEYYYLKDQFTSYGFPKISDSNYPSCGVIGLNRACNETEFLDSLTEVDPRTAPFERPAYSTVAFNVLALALSEATGKRYAQLVNEIVTEPLGMYSTFPSPGIDEVAVIPCGDSNWGTNMTYSTPGGGLVSTLSDLSRFTHGLLSRSLGLSATQIRQWLKPVSFAGGPNSFSGLPWEIFRTSDLVLQHPHPVTVYGKNGGALQYHSQISVVDEYGLALIVLTAGPMQAQQVLTDYMLYAFVPVFDQISRSEADQHYCHTFHSKGINGSGSNLNITIIQDDDSLLIKSFYRDGADVKAAIPELWHLSFGQYGNPYGHTLRLFPTELSVNKTIRGVLVQGEVWRLWPEVLYSAISDLPGAGLGTADCTAWTVEDWVYYGGEPTDRVIFYKGPKGKVIGFEAPFIRSGIMRPIS